MPRVRKTESQKETSQEEKQTSHPHQLYRSATNRVIAGVAGGLGDYFALDALVIRLIFILLTFFANGFGILLYIVLWILLPEEGQLVQNPRDTIHENMRDFRENFHKIRDDFKKNGSMHRHSWGGIILLILGLLFLTNGLGYFYGFSFHFFWPLILILLGIFLIYQQR